MSLHDIQSRADTAARLADRDPKDIALIAVSKVQPHARVESVLSQGHRIFGENRVQEAASKWPKFRAAFADVALHLLGPLQTNKLNQALDLFDVIHSLDRDKLAKKLANATQARGQCPDLFIQVNIGEEPQKAGIAPQAVDAFIATCQQTYALPIVGLMCIPPADQPAGPYFQNLQDMAARNGLSGLSMGMSADFEEAIKFGATHIRVGSAIFGKRVA